MKDYLKKSQHESWDWYAIRMVFAYLIKNVLVFMLLAVGSVVFFPAFYSFLKLLQWLKIVC